MKNLEKTLHGIKYMNTYLEAGFPRVICNIASNRRVIRSEQASELYRSGEIVKQIAKKLDVHEMTVRKWLYASGDVVKRKIKKRSGGKFEGLK
jgi:DNA invertase Pin-like site-specific DNA recombinase